MREAPSLISLCIEAIKNELFLGDDILPVIYELPSHLLDILVLGSPPLALHKLQLALPFEDRNDHEYADDGCKNGRKRGRICKFDKAWRNLLELRWPELVNRTQSVDFQQMYWEAHLQNCLDEAAEIASLPSFDGCIGDIRIPDSILKHIGYEGYTKVSNCDHAKLSYHCQQFGHYARNLRLQTVLCGSETSNLLRNSKLQSLVLRWIRSKEHIDGLCKLLIQNSESLVSLELIHCKLSSASINEICGSVSTNSVTTHGMQHFSINSSKFLETNPVSLPPGLVSFLSSGRSLHSLKFSENHLGQNFAKMVFKTLLTAASGLSILDLSENNIRGWLSDFNQKSSDQAASKELSKSLQSLRVLNLRGNNLQKEDMDDLQCALVHLPNLEVLDISDNPIEDDGIRSIMPYLIEATVKHCPLTDLHLDNCELSHEGVTQLINTLSTSKRPLKSLSVEDNFLGSQVAAAFGKFLSTSIQILNISGIGLGSLGFQELQQSIIEFSSLKLVDINISKNQGGIEAAKFCHALMLRAPELVSVNVSSNFMPAESSSIICSALKVANGKFALLDLRGNTLDLQTDASALLAEFQRTGKPVLLLPSRLTLDAPYDDDP
ncbi:hypothetical protein UlMin_031788 [Ulmus minor]